MSILQPIKGILQDSWDNITIPLQGDNISILGDRGSGKTQLFTYLIEKRLLKNYNPTALKDKTGRVNLSKLHNLTLDRTVKIRKSEDIGGETDLLEFKKKWFKKSGLIIYTIKANELWQNQYAIKSLSRHLNINPQSQALEKDNKKFSSFPAKLKDIELRINTDMEHINRWIKEFDRKPPIIIVGNYFGSAINFTCGDTRAIYRQQFMNLPIISEASNKPNDTQVFVLAGNLTHEQYAQQLVKDIFEFFVKSK